VKARALALEPARAPVAAVVALVEEDQAVTVAATLLAQGLLHRGIMEVLVSINTVVAAAVVQDKLERKGALEMLAAMV